MKPGDKREPDSYTPGHAAARHSAGPGRRPPFQGPHCPSQQLATLAGPLRGRRGLGPRGTRRPRVPVPWQANGNWSLLELPRTVRGEPAGGASLRSPLALLTPLASLSLYFPPAAPSQAFPFVVLENEENAVSSWSPWSLNS